MLASDPPQIQLDAPSRQTPLENTLIRELGVPSLVAAVLVSRGLSDPGEAHDFLYPQLEHLGDPKLLPDFDKAVSEILGARDRGDLIYVHGDYDVDGVTSASLFKRFLSKIGCNVHAHVPHREKEGYGIHRSAVQEAIDMGAKVLLTCDCGTSAHDVIEMAHQHGMRIVVTDHHTIGERKPEVEAFINPHRTDHNYPFRELCGVGVVFRLCEGISRELGFGVDGYRRAYLDLAAMGTVADIMPLVSENRIMVTHGLKQLPYTKKAGLQALMKVAQLMDKPITSRTIGYMIGPRLNAAGRIDDADKALQLLLAEDFETAMPLAAEIEGINEVRKERMDTSILEAIERLEGEDMSKVFAIVLANELWHPGVIGLTAGRLVERFGRPAYVMAVDRDQDLAKGSARSIPGFNLYDSIVAHNSLMQGGGHAMAAGFSCKPDVIPEIREKLNSYAAERLTSKDFLPRIDVDLEVTMQEITKASVAKLDMMEPFGEGNREPTFLMRDVILSKVTPVRNDAVQVRFKDGPSELKGCMFRMPEVPANWLPGSRCDVAGKLQLKDGWLEFFPSHISIHESD